MSFGFRKQRRNPVIIRPLKSAVMDDKIFFYSAAVDPAPQSHRAAKRAALERDGYKCIATGVPDVGKYSILTSEERQMRGWDSAYPFPTNLCHIFPPYTDWDLNLNEPSHPKIMHAEYVWELVHGFGGIRVLDELSGDRVHRLSNGLTLATHVHSRFSQLNLWFDEVPDHPNTYWVRSITPVYGSTTTPITFTSTSPMLELPDPRYLALHAAVCRVAHMSGVADYLDKLDEDGELVTVLDRNGASGELLASRLHDPALSRQ